MPKNPFTPSFGMVPAHMAGRDELLQEMSYAFENGLGDPNLSTVLVGARGTGKTALLARIAALAEGSGWLAVNVVAAPGMLEDILQQGAEVAADFVDLERKKSLTGLSIGQIISADWSIEVPIEANWRTRMNRLLKGLEPYDMGLLITVDEIRADIDEMVQLAAVYQLFVREGRKVSLVMAGLPKHAFDLVSDKSVSFLRRARHHYLGRISDVDIECAFLRTVEDGGKRIDRGALGEAVRATGGFPYMMQLIGYRAWIAAGDSPSIDVAHVERGIELARCELRQGVLNSTYRELSKGDRNFLFAMLPDDGESTLTGVAQRLGKKTNYASTYKARLLDQGVIEEHPGGTFGFSLPFFREYLEEMS